MEYLPINEIIASLPNLKILKFDWILWRCLTLGSILNFLKACKNWKNIICVEDVTTYQEAMEFILEDYHDDFNIERSLCEEIYDMYSCQGIGHF